jgi:hypothetical protein
MSIEKNVRVVKDFFAAIGSGDKQRVLALVAEDIEWIVPGEDWPLAGTHRGHAGLADVLKKASEEIEMTYPEPPEFVAQGDRILVVGVATGKFKVTNKPFKDNWVFDITVRNGKLTHKHWRVPPRWTRAPGPDRCHRSHTEPIHKVHKYVSFGIEVVDRDALLAQYLEAVLTHGKALKE